MGLQSFCDKEIFDYKKFATKAAKDLGYPKSVIKEIKDAKSDEEISRIMKIARERAFDDENFNFNGLNEVNKRRARKQRKLNTKHVRKSTYTKVKCLKTGKIYNSINEAAADLGVSQSNIVACCKGRINTCGGTGWEYVD